MAIVTWKDSYSVKVTQFDLHHKHLVELINSLHDAMLEKKTNEYMSTLLDELIQYTQYHFSAEEAAMEKHHFPGLVEHRKQHQELTADVLQFQSDFQTGKLMISIPILNFLRDWLVKHIQGADAQYSDFFNSKGLK